MILRIWYRLQGVCRTELTTILIRCIVGLPALLSSLLVLTAVAIINIASLFGPGPSQLRSTFRRAASEATHEKTVSIASGLLQLALIVSWIAISTTGWHFMVKIILGFVAIFLILIVSSIKPLAVRFSVSVTESVWWCYVRYASWAKRRNKRLP